MIRLHFFFSWLSMNTSGSVPMVSTCYVLYTMYEICSSISLALTEVLGVSKVIRCNSFMIFNSFLDDDSFWELFLMSLIMKSEGSSVQNFLFTETETVFCWVKFPVVVSVLLFPRSIVSVSLPVHSRSYWVISNKSSSHWVKHFFCIFESLRRDTKFHCTSPSFFRPFVLS
jgi:hypothetical protein